MSTKNALQNALNQFFQGTGDRDQVRKAIQKLHQSGEIICIEFNKESSSEAKFTREIHIGFCFWPKRSESPSSDIENFLDSQEFLDSMPTKKNHWRGFIKFDDGSWISLDELDSFELFWVLHTPPQCFSCDPHC